MQASGPKHSNIGSRTHWAVEPVPAVLAAVVPSYTASFFSKPKIVWQNRFIQACIQTYTVNNRILTPLLGGAVPESTHGTVDSTYYTHYSPLSTMEANWGLGTLSNVYSFIADATGYTNLDVSLTGIPLTNITGTIPGPLNVQYYVPITASNTSAVGAGGGPVFVVSGVDTSFTAAKAPAPVNLIAQAKTVSWLGPRVGASSSNSSSGSRNGAAGAREGIVGATVFGVPLAGVVTLLLA
ncbi:hypothetical protein EDB85DRAFT_2155672 [Lactarius pseudohatsudake]|nr:hypothetical protein EDB85DRAFT_2155672 [Lactarius pseudohatsudake]